MKRRWRFIHSGALSPAENMAIDEAIMLVHSEGKTLPTLRFYEWSPATLSIGYFQKAEDEVDLEAIEREKVGFVRRPTGGRAVLHDQELTYSMIVSERYEGLPKTVNESYRVLSEGLLLGFQKLGLQAEMVSLASEDDQARYASMGSAACFDSPSWYELVVEGRKAAGSAQTRQKGVVLQHGSILLELDADLLFSLLRFPNDRLRERLKRNFIDKAVAINHLRRSLGLEVLELRDVERAMKEGIKESLNIEFVHDELTNEEKELANELVRQKYGNDAWTFRR